MTAAAEADTVVNAPKPTGLRVWWLAARPKTLPAAMSGVIVATALAWRDGGFSLGPAMAAFAIALLLQIGSNLANDVYDDEKGADTEDRLGPQRATAQGWLTRSQVKRGMAVVFVVAFVLGLYLTWVRGWFVLVIGISAIVAAIAYTGGPYPLGYHGLGEVFVFIFFGPAAVVGTYWVQTGEAPISIWIVSSAIGLLITAILVVNNLRDIEQDRVAGKHTIAVRIGTKATKGEWLLFVALAYLVVVAAVAAEVAVPGSSLIGWGALAALASLPIAWSTGRIVFTQTGRVLNQALAATGKLALAFGVLLSAGVIAEKLLS